MHKAKKGKWRKAGKWVHYPEVDKVEQGAAITQESVKGFRDGLAKFSEIKDNTPMLRTIAYRATLDLDHLLRLMQSTPGTIIAQYKFEVRPKHKKDHARFRKEVREMKRQQRRKTK